MILLIRQVSGTPYVWGGNTAAGTDCSGLASWVSNVASGRPVFGDRFTTRNEEAALLERGEVTRNGRVLPIGGVKQKLLAAQRAGLSTVFIPQRNEPDLDDVPAEVLGVLDVRPMTDVADIVAQALEPAGAAAPAPVVAAA
ncbi:MAG TPA: S16 family serine protease [Mycobacterium sp.]|nr:S16 family serine protease [Mycobacterium sp.]